MKKILKTGVIALSCASAFAFSACSAAVSGGISPNWYANSTLTTAISDTYEKLTYRVEYQKGANENYSVTYQPGVYTVILENTTYREESVYKLTSELQISGTYTLGAETLDFTDSVVSECFFRDANRFLYPLYSKKTVHTATPRANNADSLHDAVAQYAYRTEITYDPNGNSATSVYTDLNDETKNNEYSYSLKNNYTVLDNENLLFAVRGFSLSSGSTNRAYVLDPYNREQGSVNVTLTAQTAEQTYSFRNTDAGDAQAKEYVLAVNTVQIRRNAFLAGKTLTAFYAAPTTGTNVYRSVLLKLESPLSYGMGTLVYTLTEADFANK